jgi:hypothetical protein
VLGAEKVFNDEKVGIIFIKQSIKLFTFTTEAQRSQRKRFFLCREVSAKKKFSGPIRGV